MFARLPSLTMPQTAPAAGRAARLPVPGPACGDYPQRSPAHEERGPAVAWKAAADRVLARHRARSRQAFVARVRGLQRRLPPPGSQAFADGLRELRAQLGRHGFGEALLAEAFARLSSSCEAVLGLRPYDTQLIAARILLDNRLAEMATGEGKTHAVMLAAAVAALAGVPVHVATANAYLAARDAAQGTPLYAAIGLTTAAIQPGQDDAARRAAWRCDIVYCTASDLVFDYLRDRLAADAAGRAEPLLQGLCMAIVDEADSVLIDEARTPFVLARERIDAQADARHRRALALARGLRGGEHFALDAPSRTARLTPAGAARVAALAAPSPPGADGAGDPLWGVGRHRDELVERALAALHLYRRDVDYLVRDCRGQREIAIIDPTTGRVAEGRRWSHGLHQLIEQIAGCAASRLQEPVAQLTYQRFFPRYWRLAGTSGTLREARAELRRVYGLGVETVPLRRPSRRVHAPPQLYARADARWDAALDAIARSHAAGAPVLVGCDSVADARRLSERLAARGLDHQRLDARQDGDEAAHIARAGTRGCITVTTNMAGRGTDIALAAGVSALGGLHVIACQHNASPRIDRQLHGRCARAGDPGRVTTLLSLDEGLLAQNLPRALRAVLGRAAPHGQPLPPPLAAAVLACVQAGAERRARRERARLLASDRQLLDSLGFGARAE